MFFGLCGPQIRGLLFMKYTYKMIFHLLVLPQRMYTLQRAPLKGHGHASIPPPVFLHPVRISSAHAHVPGMSLKLPGPGFKV